MSQTTIFADALSEGIIVNGVARLTFSRVIGENKIEPGGLVVIPLAQIPNMINSLGMLMKQVEEKFKAAQSKAENHEQNGAGTGDAIPSSFSFTHKN